MSEDRLLELMVENARLKERLKIVMQFNHDQNEEIKELKKNCRVLIENSEKLVDLIDLKSSRHFNLVRSKRYKYLGSTTKDKEIHD